MSSKECEMQLNELLEAWDLDEATLNQTDIEAIKHLLLENQMQQDVIISYKTTNLDQAVDIQQLEQENQQLKEKYRIRSEAYDKILLENADLKDKIEQQTKVCLADHKYASSKEDEVIVLTHERDLYKSVIDEIREYVENNVPITHYSFNGILEILDKAKENK